jgi:hypothetical protein
MVPTWYYNSSKEVTRQEGDSASQKPLHETRALLPPSPILRAGDTPGPVLSPTELVLWVLIRYNRD